MSTARAYGIASMWGSLIRAGDPGACFYGFHFNDGRPASEAHRADCIRYTESLLDGQLPMRDRQQLLALRQFFETSPLH